MIYIYANIFYYFIVKIHALQLTIEFLFSKLCTTCLYAIFLFLTMKVGICGWTQNQNKHSSCAFNVLWLDLVVSWFFFRSSLLYSSIHICHATMTMHRILDFTELNKIIACHDCYHSCKWNKRKLMPLFYIAIAYWTWTEHTLYFSIFFVLLLDNLCDNR